MKTASMFLSELTVVDHAYIDDAGVVRGGSFHPSFLVSGPVDEVEKVVVDFSTVKKELKGLLDDDQQGFDHKLWLIEGTSKVTFKVYGEGAETSDDYQTPHARSNDPRRVRLTMPTGTLDLPLDAVKLIAKQGPTAYNLANAGVWFEQYLNKRLPATHPGVSVVCRNSTAKHVYDPSGGAISDFRYVHGLKDSTSWGCQNIAHGHLSFLQLIGAKPDDEAQLKKLSGLIAQELQDAVFVRQENILADKNGTLQLGYGCERGKFSYDLDKSGNRIVILPTETTIEFLTDYVRQRWNKELAQAGCRWLFVSEGLTKGAASDLKSA
jgi:6-pyruvoyl-tetrahydropterin synthase